MADEGLEGRCTCGEVRYRLNASPLIVHACHCTECQRLSGAAFAVNAMVETERVELLAGQPEPAVVTGTSGLAQTVMRCPTCRVALWSHYPRSGRRIAFVRVGTLDEPARVPPDIHIFTSTKLPWLDLPKGARRFPNGIRRRKSGRPTAFAAGRRPWPEPSRRRSRRSSRTPCGGCGCT